QPNPGLRQWPPPCLCLEKPKALSWLPGRARPCPPRNPPGPRWAPAEWFIAVPAVRTDWASAGGGTAIMPAMPRLTIVSLNMDMTTLLWREAPAWDAVAAPCPGSFSDAGRTRQRPARFQAGRRWLTAALCHRHAEEVVRVGIFHQHLDDVAR